MPLCPDCGSEVMATDTNCMDCGVDLLAAKEKERQVLREQSQAARSGGGGVVPKNPAAGGAASIGEKSSDETRIRAFDKQEAERLTAERSTAWVTAGIGLLLGLVALFIGLSQVKSGGGFGELAGALKPAALREGALFSSVVLGLSLLGMGVSGVLVGIGQIRLAMSASRAIDDVKHNRKPEIAQVSTFTLIGLFFLAIFCPPLGLIVGLIMFFGRNPDLKGLGGNMALVSIIIIGLLGFNMLWKVFEGMKAAAPAKPAAK